MRLITLELDNFRQYAHARIDFETGVTAIVGANGSGKTTLVEAILWALYGARGAREGVDTLRFLWSQGGAKVRVVLEFELGNRRYRIRRTPTEAELAQMNSDGGWLMLARGTTAVNERVLQLLGMNLLQFQTSFCARQKELEFLAYTPQKRREEISRMLGYERITEALEQVSLAVRTLDAEVEGLRQGIGDPHAIQQQLQSVEAALQQTEAALRAEEAALNNARAQRDTAKRHYEAQHALREQYLALQQQRALLHNDYEHLQRRKEELRAQWAQLKHACDRYKAIEADARRYRAVAEALAEQERLAQAHARRAQLQAQQDALQQQHAHLQAEQTELQRKQQALQNLQSYLQQADQLRHQLEQLRQIAQQAPQRARIEAQIQSLQQQVESLRQQQTERDALQHAVEAAHATLSQHQQACADTEAQLQSVLHAWNRARADAEAEARSLSQTLKQQRARIQQLESLGESSECPTCGQSLGSAYREVLQRAYTEVQATENALCAARERLENLQQEPAEAHQLRTQLDAQQRARDAAQHQLAQLQAQLRQRESELQHLPTLERQIHDLQRQLAQLPVYDPQEEQRLRTALEHLQPHIEQAQQLQGELRRLPAVERELQQTERSLQQLQKEIAKLPQGYDAERHAALRAEAEQLRPLYEEALQLKPMIQQRAELHAQIETAKQSLKAKATELEQVEQQIQQLGYSEEVYLQAARAYQQAEETASALENAVATRRAEHARQTALRDHLKSQLEQIEQRQRQLREKERELLLCQTLRKALQEFRTELNARLRPTLAGIATEFLSTLTNGRYTELDIDEEFRFTVIDEGHRKAVISGGEEDIVNLSLRLALARLITERAGQPLSLLILDEVFASLDAERRQNVMELLNNLRSWFDQILVISHFEEINEAADRCLRVRRNPLTRASEIMEPELPDMGTLLSESLEP